MSAIKERILGAVTVMSEADAEKVWKYVLDNLSSRSWDDIGETAPDDWDLKMLDDIEHNPECHEFVSQEDVLRELGL